MAWIPFFLAIFLSIYFSRKGKSEIDAIKREGLSADGIIIQNTEVSPRKLYRLGGNINRPVIQFRTQDGQEIIGQSVNGLITQYEVVVPSMVGIMYRPEDPKIFYIVSVYRPEAGS